MNKEMRLYAKILYNQIGLGIGGIVYVLGFLGFAIYIHNSRWYSVLVYSIALILEGFYLSYLFAKRKKDNFMELKEEKL